MIFVAGGTYVLSKYFIDRSYRDELLRVAKLSGMFYLEKDEVNQRAHNHIKGEFRKVSDVAIGVYRTDSSVYIDDDVYFTEPEDFIKRTIRDGEFYFKAGDRSFVSLYYQDNEGDFVILVSGLNESGKEQLRILGQMLLLFGVLGSGLHLLFSRVLAEKTFEPFQTLIRQVRSIRGNDWHVRLNFPRKDDDEVKQFISEFNHLLDRIESSVNIQRSFLRHASHEIKTPLAIITGDIEVTLQSTRTHEEYVQVLSSLKSNSLHLRSVIDSLTTLSDLEVAGSDLVTKFRIDEVIWEVVEKKTIEYRGRKINVQFKDDSNSNEEILFVTANRALILIAISNLVDNAIKYSDDAVEIMIKATQSPLTIEINDSGVGIASDEVDKIFHLFYRSTYTRHIQGHGIGLYLVRQIAELSNAIVEVKSKPGSGTSFVITFPGIH